MISSNKKMKTKVWWIIWKVPSISCRFRAHDRPQVRLQPRPIRIPEAQLATDGTAL